MNKKYLIIVKYPLVLIGLMLCVSGIRWMISSEPWLLDQVANEERLKMTFIELFEISGNETLSKYLTQIYRFLGLYVLGIGALILSFLTEKTLLMGGIRNKVLLVIGVLLVANLIIAYYWISSSHFIYLMWLAIILYLVSLYYSRLIK